MDELAEGIVRADAAYWRAGRAIEKILWRTFWFVVIVAIVVAATLAMVIGGGPAAIKPANNEYIQANQIATQASSEVDAIEQQMRTTEQSGNPPTVSERLTLQQTKVAVANVLMTGATFQLGVALSVIASILAAFGVGVAVASKLVR